MPQIIDFQKTNTTKAEIPGVIPTRTVPGIWGDILDFGIDIVKDIIPGSVDDRIIDRYIDRLTAPTPTTTFGPTGPCGPLQTNIGGVCVDATPGRTTPAERSVGGTGFASPLLVQRNRMECPTIPGQKQGIIWFSPQTDSFVCLPRGMAGGPLGLVRKNKPRPKAKVSAHEWKMLKKFGDGGSLGKTAKAMAKLTGQVCESKAARARKTHHHHTR